ncbi:hypothetical protein BKA57DRAFT_453833 [Linnemannia elongata]|nr:hypothetical protein BKA57DRAFT_453833 [Linnemannia elongata]
MEEIVRKYSVVEFLCFFFGRLDLLRARSVASFITHKRCQRQYFFPLVGTQLSNISVYRMVSAWFLRGGPSSQSQFFAYLLPLPPHLLSLFFSRSTSKLVQ